MEISNKQKPRDYDKEPLVINGYEKFFAIAWYLVLLFSVLTIAIIEDFIECGSFMFAKRRSYEFGNVRDSYCYMYL